MKLDRFFIKQQYEEATHIKTVGELRKVYRQRDRSLPVTWDTETTSLHYGVPNVLYDPTAECAISEQLYPVVFGVSMAVVVKPEFVTDGGTGLYLMWCRKGTKLFDAAVRLLADDATKLWYNSKYDSRVCEANGIKIGGRQEDAMVMARLFWNRRRAVGLKKVTEFLVPELSCWSAPIDKELTRLKNKYTRMINKGELEWPYEKVDYANYSHIAESIMSEYASLDAFMTLMVFLRLQGECVWR